MHTDADRKRQVLQLGAWAAVILLVCVGGWAAETTLRTHARDIAKINRQGAQLANAETSLREAIGELRTIARVGSKIDCRRINDVQDRIVQFVADTHARSRRQQQAVVNSPTAARAEKRAATANLKEIERFLASTRREFADADCTKPPDPVTTTTAGR